MRLVPVVLCLLAFGAIRAQSVGAEVGKAEALGARTGVCVLSSDGRVLYRHRAGVAVPPASNMKILSVAAVLHGLGGGFRFVTRFSLRGGALRVEASGDPNWITGTAHDPQILFGEVAAALQRLGVENLAGLELDAGPFTGPSRPSSWPKNQLHTYYAAPTGPFLLEQGTFVIRIDPRAGGRTARGTLVAPPFGPPVSSRVVPVARSGVFACGAIDRGERILVRGKLSRSSRAVEIRTAVGDPRRWYEQNLRAVLERAGIAIGPGATTPGDRVVHEIRTELGPALLRVLEDSSNVDAEQCVRVLGAVTTGDGSLAGGRAAMEAELRGLLGHLPSAIELVDASGLSATNRVTPAVVAATLHAATRQPWFETFRQALPIAGRTGTLASRFRDTPLVGRVRAKTGWILGASALSGYVEGGAGKRITFSILMDYPRNEGIRNKSLKRAQERIVAAIARTWQSDG